MTDTQGWVLLSGKAVAVASVAELREAARDCADAVLLVSCPDCGGSGFGHCCDGICAQPELAAEGVRFRRWL
jgi:hypothetical protein